MSFCSEATVSLCYLKLGDWSCPPALVTWIARQGNRYVGVGLISLIINGFNYSAIPSLAPPSILKDSMIKTYFLIIDHFSFTLGFLPCGQKYVNKDDKCHQQAEVWHALEWACLFLTFHSFHESMWTTRTPRSTLGLLPSSNVG